ncbi:MAG: SH3 domain-containing protein [Anaerolineales bacterium]|nr:SH3 domain-containing protein [Anaerolineales bacterium]
MPKIKSSRLILIAALALLMGGLLVGVTALPTQAVQPTFSQVEGQFSASRSTSLISAYLQGSGVILLNPFAGPSSSPITANGQNWPGGELVVIYLSVGGEEYAVASAVAGTDGSFQASFFIPLSQTDENFVTVLARAASGTQAQALYTITDNAPASVPTPEPASPQGVITAQVLNVRSGPGTNYPVLGRLTGGQVVDISGLNGDWYRVSFLNTSGDYGWVNKIYLSSKNTGDLPLFRLPPRPRQHLCRPPPPVPPPAFACNPGQWSGCGGASCQAEYVSQCGGDGQWQQCVWDPGSCSPYRDNNNNNDNDNDNDNRNNNDNRNDNNDN